MLNRFRCAWGLAVVSAALCLGCPQKSGDSEKSEPTRAPSAEQASAKPATTGTVAHVIATATGSTGPLIPVKYRKLTDDEVAVRVKQIMAKHTIHPEHSFGLNLKGFEGSVLATTGPEGKVFVFHLFNSEGRRTTSLVDKDRNESQGNKLVALAFEDVDHDSHEDLVVLASYADGNGVSVYTRPGGGPFAFNSALSKKAGGPASMAAALAALR